MSRFQPATVKHIAVSSWVALCCLTAACTGTVVGSSARPQASELPRKTRNSAPAAPLRATDPNTESTDDPEEWRARVRRGFVARAHLLLRTLKCGVLEDRLNDVGYIP